MGTPEGREVLYDLARRADVFLTSFLPSARRKFAIDVDDIRAVNPRIVYARGSALGPRGAESDRGGYDMTAFWCRGTSAASLTPPNVRRPDQPAARLRGHHLGHQPGRRHRRGPAQAGAHRRALGGGRLAARQRPVDDGPRPRGVPVPRPGLGGARLGVHGAPDEPAVRPVPHRRRPLPVPGHAAARQVLGRRLPHVDRPEWPTTPVSPPPSSSRPTPRKPSGSLQEVIGRPHPGRVGRALRHPGRARGPRSRTPSRPAATRRSGPTSTSCPPGSSSWPPSPVQFDVTAPQLRPGPRVRRADRGDPAGTRPGLGPHHRPQGSRRRHLTTPGPRFRAAS